MNFNQKLNEYLDRRGVYMKRKPRRTKVKKVFVKEIKTKPQQEEPNNFKLFDRINLELEPVIPTFSSF